MDFNFTEEQKAIAELADGIFRELCSDARLEEFDQTDDPIMQDVWEQCIESGLHALAVPEEAGGFGLGMTELMIVLQAQGRYLVQVPLWQHQLAVATVYEFLASEQKLLLDEAVKAEKLLTFSLDSATDAIGVQVQATDTTDGFLLNGQVNAVPFGQESDAALILAKFSDNVRLVLVNLHNAGVERIPGNITNGGSIANLQLNDVQISDNQVLDVRATDWLEHRLIAALSSLQLGVSEEQIRRTIEYVNDRVQFDRAIGTFQAVQMTMADTYIALENLRTVLWQLAYRLDANLSVNAEVLSCKYFANETGHLVGHKAQHVHGGVGVDLSYPIFRFLYWSRTLGITQGGSLSSLERLGDWLNENNTLGWKYDLEEPDAIS